MKTSVGIISYVHDEPGIVLVWLPIRIPCAEMDAAFDRLDRDAVEKVVRDATAEALVRIEPGSPGVINSLLQWWAARMEHRAKG